MAFIPNQKNEAITIGDWVELQSDISTLSGTFTKGHIMLVMSNGERGFDLRDKAGNWLRETGLVEDKFKKI